MILNDQRNIIITSGALTFLSASLFSYLFVAFAFRIGAVDSGVGERRMHKEPRARIGGVCMYVAFLFGISVIGYDQSLLPLIAGGGAVTMGGIFDDVYGITPLQKIFVQSFSASVALLLGTPTVKIEAVSNLSATTGRIIEYFISCLLIVTLCNAFNLIDGLDGLCAGATSGSIAALIFFAPICQNATLIFLAAILGFLPRNLRPAKLFLGDSGAMLSGFFVGVITLNAAQGKVGILPLVLIVAYPLFEVVFSVLRRILSGNHPFAPDRGHLHHRLCDRGMSHGGASALLILLHWGFCAFAVTLSESGFGYVSIMSFILLTFALTLVIIMARDVKKPKGV